MSQQVVPSQMVQQLFEGKTKAAKKGHELLKKKCDALKTKFRTIMLGLLETKKNMGAEASDAFLLYAKAQWAAGEFHQNVKDAVKRATIRVDMTKENIAGVQLPIMHIRELEDVDSNLSQIGISRGGQAIQKCRDKFKDLLHILVKIASLQTSFVTLDEVIKVTNRRVNALEYIVIPKFVEIVRYIKQEIEEIGREELFGLKKVLDQRRKLQEESNKAADKKALEANREGKESDNLLEDVDEDILF
eukprot:TRINITY_DN1100_c0_g1_i1.p1 TRINITY_DN1100_c0_g1~~TRINITY_DN1100_c0_g1_i1.p1  ORF type:complete len:246 (-),score=58.83 TRINITY_DN1100_c0_g1_i1:116-853(-)